MKRISSLLTIAALVFATSGCLKDDGFDDHEFGVKETSNQPPGIVLPESGNEINSRSIDNVTTSQVVLGPAVVLADDKVADKDIHITLVIDDALRQKYNLENGTDLKALPGSLYNIPSLTVTIPKGKSLDTLKVVVPNATLFDLTQKYGIGFSVASVQEPGYTIADNMKNFLMSVVIKNEFEGDYHAEGVFHHPTAGDRGIDEDKYLITYGATAVQANLADLGGQGYTMILNINPDNTVTITKSGATPNVDQHWGPNFYDPATKSFHLHYSYNTAAPRIVEETITLK